MVYSRENSSLKTKEKETCTKMEFLGATFGGGLVGGGLGTSGWSGGFGVWHFLDFRHC